ncbi:hypothetical protein VNO77_22598 [Canavalia gladiata]|uniref:Uncharacterized protein n=1 Tax=Canavalia gladiata TaxID=3824 RepID=A0AAN9QB54_CANGL
MGFPPLSHITIFPETFEGIKESGMQRKMVGKRFLGGAISRDGGGEEAQMWAGPILTPILKLKATYLHFLPSHDKPQLQDQEKELSRSSLDRTGIKSNDPTVDDKSGLDCNPESFYTTNTLKIPLYELVIAKDKETAELAITIVCKPIASHSLARRHPCFLGASHLMNMFYNLLSHLLIASRYTSNEFMDCFNDLLLQLGKGALTSLFAVVNSHALYIFNKTLFVATFKIYNSELAQLIGLNSAATHAPSPFRNFSLIHFKIPLLPTPRTVFELLSPDMEGGFNTDPSSPMQESNTPSHEKPSLWIGNPLEEQMISSILQPANSQPLLYLHNSFFYNGKPLSDSPIPLVYAGNASNSFVGYLCIPDSLIPSKVSGKIVICERGAKIAFLGSHLEVQPYPVVAAFSSRGPNALTSTIIKL